MSGKSNEPGGIISTPQGGGALQGIGEAFSPDLQTGTGNFSVPISLPLGRNGLQPQLTLQYSTGHGNGPFGLGWALSIPGVSRKTSNGIPRYDDASDTFLLSGAEDLVPVPVAPQSPARYRPRTEGLFAHIDHHRDAQSNYWQVASKDGLISYYGTPRPTGGASDWQDPATIVDPQRPAHVFAWRLTQTIDPFGNRIEYLYERDTVQTDGPHHWDQVYLSEIRYADYGDPNTPKFLVSVRFTYELRPDPFSQYKSGFEIRSVRRCTRIDIVTNPGTEIAVRTYHLTYLNQRRLDATKLPANGMSLLSQIQVEGHDGSASEWMPPLEFGYTQFEPKRRRFAPVTGIDLPPASLADPSYELADLLGNGLPDILEMNGTVRYWRNLGGGRFDLPRPMRDAPVGLQLADPGVQLLDADGDGRVDLLVTTPAISGYFPMGFDGLWDRRSFHRYRVAPSFNLEDPEVRLVDLTGDGVTDALRSSTRFDCFFNDPETGWGETRRIERQALDVFPDVDFTDPRVKWADMSGDGMQDIGLIHSGSVDYWPNLGYGNWGKRIHMLNSPRLPHGYNPQRILVGDVDGDGLADIVYVDDRRITLWINQSGNAWSDPIVIEGTPPVTDMDAVRLADLLGVGTAGVFWTANVSALPGPRMFFLDLTGATKPYLLSEMDNHIGSLTRVAYASSTSFYLLDQRQLATQWRTPLPFPVQVVARVEAIDAISGGKLTTEYSYHHGYWDGAEREFRGFGRVDQRDTEIFAEYHGSVLHGQRPFNTVLPKFFSPPTETRSWFHLGPVGDEFGGWTEVDFSSEFWADDPQVLSRPRVMTAFLDTLPRRVKRDALRALRGRVLRSEFYGLDGTQREIRPYTVTEHLGGVREEARPGPDKGDRLRIFFPHNLAERTTQWERGIEPMTQFAFSPDYDTYGQSLAQCDAAVPRGRDFTMEAAPGAPYLATATRTTYAQRDDPQRYCVDRVARLTSYEILNNGSSTVFQLASGALGGLTATRLIGQTYTYYDGAAFQGRPFGQLGDYGAVVRNETLVLTEEMLDQAYRSGDTVLRPPERPPYLVTGGAPLWTAEYPTEFRNILPPLAGFVFHQGGPDPEDAAGFFAATSREYDFQRSGSASVRGLLMVQRDALGHDTATIYDPPYQLLPVSVTDPAGLTTAAAYDYRVMKPGKVTDPNGNSTSLTYTPLSLLATTSVTGKAGEGDQQSPSILKEYDFLAFDGHQQPISVRTIRRAYHDTQTEVPLPKRDETIETIEYSDGFGRLVQTRTPAEDVIFGDPVFGTGVLSPNQAGPQNDATGTPSPSGSGPWISVTGWQVYSNKGKVVEKYEPFFSTGRNYAPPTSAQFGRKVSTYYDPRGLAIRTVNADGSEQRVINGVPGSRLAPDLTDPNVFEPTPWESYTYDANDNAGRTHPATSASYQTHWNTPSSATCDALGRTIESTARNGLNPATDWYVTTSTYDILGNLLTIADTLGRLAFQYAYDLAKHQLRVESIDAGTRRSILNALGSLVEHRDSKDAFLLHAYDLLIRPIRLWARDGAGQKLTLRERLIYGDGPDSGLTRGQAAALNLLGRPYRHYDEAGLLELEHSDFKGNVLEKTRRVISDATILAVFNPPPPNWQVQTFRVDWQPPIDVSLDATVFRISTTYDALNRVQRFLYPQDVTGARKALTPQYNRAGALEHLDLNGTVYVDRIAYDANGQRSLIAYGNGIMTRYAYDPQTFRLVRLRSEPYATPTVLTYHPSGTPLQDFAYDFDLVGNLLTVSDRTPGGGIPNTLLGTNALDRTFSYDPIYRLLTANGRECAVQQLPPPWDDTPRCADVTLTRAYAETYTYDAVGNFFSLRHSTGSTRNFNLVSGTNRLASVAMGSTNFAYLYDATGNMVRENSSRHFEWDHCDRMRAYRTQSDGAEPSVHAHYLYDAGGQRTKKLVRKQGGHVEVTVYIDGLFEYHCLFQGPTTQRNNAVHVMDANSRIAIVRIGPTFPTDTTPPVKYNFSDHLGSSNVVIDGSGQLVNREEYTPYGETSFGSFARKRYRFTGKERDEESGLYYFGARYCAPWLGRWVSSDPAGMLDGTNLYQYARSNPIVVKDPDGLQSAVATSPTPSNEFLHNNWREMGMLRDPTEAQGPNLPKVGDRSSSPAGERVDSTAATPQSTSENIIHASEVVIEAPVPYEPQVSVPGAVERASGMGHIESGDLIQFAKGLYNGPAAVLHLPQISVDPRYAGAERVGSELGTNLAGEGAGAVVAKAGVAIGALRGAIRSGLGSGRAYSVALETTLETRWPKALSNASRRLVHAQEAEEAFAKAIEVLGKSKDRASRALATRLGKLIADPAKWVMHHDPEREGVMQLIPKAQHTAAEIQDLLHPYVEIIKRRAGGFYFWGRKF